MSQPDTKATWKRRALRDEAELEGLRKIRDSETDMQRSLLSLAFGFVRRNSLVNHVGFACEHCR